MRYVGCKRRLLPFIHDTLKQYHIDGDTFCDLFAGTATVGHYFKQHGWKIISNDWLYTAYIWQTVRVGLNRMPCFQRLAAHLQLPKTATDNYAAAVLDYLNQLSGMEGFIYQHYSPGGTAQHAIPRGYFTDLNAKKIDAIRDMIAAWQQLGLINHAECCVLLYALLQAVSKHANTTATQTAFLKSFTPTASQPLQLHMPLITPSHVTHQIYCQDSVHLAGQLPEVDILYCDPPYTRRQYATAYHLLETIARGEYPTVHGISGVPVSNPLCSPFSRKHDALSALQQIVAQRRYRHLLLSYSNEGLLSHDTLLAMLARYGEVVVAEHPLPRYRSMAHNDPRNQATSANVIERLYYVKPVAPSSTSAFMPCHQAQTALYH